MKKEPFEKSMEKLAIENPEAFSFIKDMVSFGFEIQPFQVHYIDLVFGGARKLYTARTKGKGYIPLLMAAHELIKQGEVDLKKYGISGERREDFADILCGKVHTTIYGNKAVLHEIEF